jgi:hypothetical protein
MIMNFNFLRIHNFGYLFFRIQFNSFNMGLFTDLLLRFRIFPHMLLPIGIIDSIEYLAMC